MRSPYGYRRIHCIPFVTESCEACAVRSRPRRSSAQGIGQHDETLYSTPTPVVRHGIPSILARVALECNMLYLLIAVAIPFAAFCGYVLWASTYHQRAMRALDFVAKRHSDAWSRLSDDRPTIPDLGDTLESVGSREQRALPGEPREGLR